MALKTTSMNWLPLHASFGRESRHMQLRSNRGKVLMKQSQLHATFGRPLRSVGKTIVRSNGRGIQIRDIDAYLFGIFIHRFNRALRKERKRRQMFQYFASTRELELLRQAHDSRAARDIEQSVQAKEAVQNLDEWPRKVWIARKYGYSFPEIASFLGMSEAQVKLRFRYALARLREKLGL